MTFCMVFIIYVNTYVALPNTDHQGWFLRPAGPIRSEMSYAVPSKSPFFFGWGVATRKKFRGKGFFVGLGFLFVCGCVIEPMSIKYHGIKGKFPKKNNSQTSKVCEWYGSRLWEEGAPTIPGEIPNWNDDDSPFSTQRCDTSRMPLPPRNMALSRDH